MKTAAEELGILGGIDEGRCCGGCSPRENPWVDANSKERTSVAEAHGHFGSVCGTTEVVP